MKLELTDQEQEMLSDVLRSFLSELRTEVVRTDQRAYRERLKGEEKAVKQILNRLEHRAAGPLAGEQSAAMT